MSRLPYSLLLSCVLAAILSVAGCGGSGGSDPHQALPGAEDSKIPSVSGRAGGERCPRSLPPGRSAAEEVLGAVPREIRRAFPNIDRKGYRVFALFTLEPEVVAPGPRHSRYVRVGARGCGKRTTTRSWVAIFSFPHAPSAAFAPAIAFFARTEPGWRIWYVWYPNMPSSGFPP